MLFFEKCKRKNNIVINIYRTKLKYIEKNCLEKCTRKKIKINILQKKTAYGKPARQKSKSKFKNAMHKKEII